MHWYSFKPRTQFVRNEPNIYLLNQLISSEEQNSALKDNKPSIIEQIPGLVFTHKLIIQTTVFSRLDSLKESIEILGSLEQYQYPACVVTPRPNTPYSNAALSRVSGNAF